MIFTKIRHIRFLPVACGGVFVKMSARACQNSVKRRNTGSKCNPASPGTDQWGRSKRLVIRGRLWLKADWKQWMQDLLDKGHAIEVPPAEIGWQDGKVRYLPHHPVVNPNKDKLCIVFDCAAQHLGVSLDSKVLQGPDLTNKLIGVLTRFRLHQIALMADVEGMFHQVRVEVNDQDALRFLWWLRGNTDEAPRTYRITVHLFGGTWSPSYCTYAVHRTVQYNVHQFSEAACETVKRNFYVDDCLKSVSTVEEAITLTKELKGLLARGGFNLTKWTSNHPAVLEEIPSHDQSKKAKERSIDAPMEDRALGVYWNMEEDYLGIARRAWVNPSPREGSWACWVQFTTPWAWLVRLSWEHEG